MLLPMGSIYDLLEQYPDEKACERYFIEKRWPNGVYCPKSDCESSDVYDCHSARRLKMWKCRKCQHKFTVTSGTVMAGTKLPLRKWMIAYHEMGSAKKGISSRHLARKLSIGLRPAWHLGHRIRATMADDSQLFSGTVESDEAYLGGRRRRHGRGYRGNKVAVQTIIKRGQATTRRDRDLARGHEYSKAQTVVLNPTDSVDGRTVGAKLRKHTIPNKTVLMTDESPIYDAVGDVFREHHTVTHKAQQYVKQEEDGHLAHTNTAEGYFGNFKRQVDGTHHHISKRHAQRYAEEHDHKYNHRNKDDTAIAEAAIANMEGKRVKLFKSKASGGDSLLPYAHDEHPDHGTARGAHAAPRRAIRVKRTKRR